MGRSGDTAVEPLRVVIVDDVDDMRLLVRLHLDRDDRFDVIGEGGDGYEAIAIAEASKPDLLILDCEMPGLSGLDALPEIRRVSPDTAVILYTANGDMRTRHAALDAGAFQVLEKYGTLGPRIVDRLVDALVERASPEDPSIEVRVGPVPSAAARVWVANTKAIIDAVAAQPDVLGAAIPSDVIDLFRSFLRQWGVVAETTEVFQWVARASAVDVTRIVEHWATIDAMTDEQLARLGIAWSPPEGQPFFQALTTGVLNALRRHEETHRLGARLREQWAPYRTSDPLDEGAG